MSVWRQPSGRAAPAQTQPGRQPSYSDVTGPGQGDPGRSQIHVLLLEVYTIGQKPGVKRTLTEIFSGGRVWPGGLTHMINKPVWRHSQNNKRTITFFMPLWVWFFGRLGGRGLVETGTLISRILPRIMLDAGTRTFSNFTSKWPPWIASEHKAEKSISVGQEACFHNRKSLGTKAFFIEDEKWHILNPTCLKSKCSPYFSALSADMVGCVALFTPSFTQITVC